MEICRKKYEQRVWVQPAEDARQSARETPPSTSAAASVHAVSAVPLETSLLDDLLKDFVPQEVASTQHRVVVHNPCFSTIPHRDAARPVDRELVVETSLLDELFKGLDAGTNHAQGDCSTAASDDERSVLGSEALVLAVAPRVAAGASTVVGVSADQEQIDARFWESFGDW